jgi:hypothetical protein
MANQVDTGAVAEHLFAAAAMTHGSMVSWPSSQMHPYDLIVDTRKNIYRVQVKGTENKTDKVRFNFRMKSGRGIRRQYLKSDTDFIVLYLFHYDTWYVFPVEDVRTFVTIHPGDPKCKYAKYANAWHLIK